MNTISMLTNNFCEVFKKAVKARAKYKLNVDEKEGAFANFFYTLALPAQQGRDGYTIEAKGKDYPYTAYPVDQAFKCCVAPREVTLITSNDRKDFLCRCLETEDFQNCKAMTPSEFIDFQQQLLNAFKARRDMTMNDNLDSLSEMASYANVWQDCIQDREPERLMTNAGCKRVPIVVTLQAAKDYSYSIPLEEKFNEIIYDIICSLSGTVRSE